MSRLRALTEHDFLGEAMEAVEKGEPVDWGRLSTLGALNVARSGRAALLDSLDAQDEHYANAERLLGGN